MHAGAIVMLAAAVALWLTYQGPVATRPVDRAGLADQLARDLAIAHQDAVAHVQATGASGSPLVVTPAHPDQTVWWPVSCSDGTWIATYAGPSREVDEGMLFRAVDGLLDGPLTVGIARAGTMVRHGTAIATLPCTITDGKTVLLTHG